MLWIWQRMVVGLVESQLSLSSNSPSFEILNRLPTNAVVMFDESTVRKEFDSRGCGVQASRNVQHNERFIPGAKVVAVGPRIEYLEYPFQQCVTTITGQHIAKILLHLEQVHGAGICHGDIRLANMVFAEQAEHSMLIDFDMSGKVEQQRYPAGYALNLPDTKRHNEASAGATLAFEHDRFSLASSFRLLKLEASDEQSAEQWRGLCDRIESREELASIARDARDFGATLTWPNEFITGGWER